MTHFDLESVAGKLALLRNAMGLSSIREPAFKYLSRS